MKTKIEKSLAHLAANHHDQARIRAFQLEYYFLKKKLIEKY